jgi:hypothetical protein
MTSTSAYHDKWLITAVKSVYSYLFIWDENDDVPWPGTSYWRERLSTLHLLVLFKIIFFFILKILSTIFKKNYLIVEVKCTEPSPWLDFPALTIIHCWMHKERDGTKLFKPFLCSTIFSFSIVSNKDNLPWVWLYNFVCLEKCGR